MQLSCPPHINILFGIAFIVLALLVVNWIFFSGIILPARPGVLRNKQEGFTNPTYTYTPSDSPNAPSVTFGLSDFVQEAERAVQFVVVDSGIDPSFTSFDDYTMRPNLKIEEYYKKVTANCIWNSGSNSTSVKTCSEGANAAMDASYGHFFDSKWLDEQQTNQSIADAWNAMVDIQIDDQLYNTVKYFAIDSNNKNKKCMSAPNKSGLSYYFLNSIIQSKNARESNSTFQKLKTAFYAVIRPRFMANTISTIYWKNQQNLTNSDQGTNASIMYVFGTHHSLIKNAEALLVDLSGSPIFSSESGLPIFTMESVILYQTAAVLFELTRFVQQFSQPSNVPSAVATTLPRFNSGFQKYLDKANQVSSPSNLTFLCNNLPDTAACSTDIIRRTLASGIK